MIRVLDDKTSGCYNRGRFNREEDTHTARIIIAGVVPLTNEKESSYGLHGLAAFLDSLRAPMSPTHAHGKALAAAEQRGQAIFHDPALGCVPCHPPPLYTASGPMT